MPNVYFHDARESVWTSGLLGVGLACVGIFAFFDRQFISSTVGIVIALACFAGAARNGVIVGENFIAANSINIFSKKIYFSDIEAEAFTNNILGRKSTYIIIYDVKTKKRIFTVMSPALLEEDIFEIYDMMLGRGVKFRSYGFSQL